MQSRSISRSTGIVEFYTPGKYPVSAARALSIGAELVDSIGLRHELREVAIAPAWWRRICSYTRYTRCAEKETGNGLRVLIIVDSHSALPPRSGADLVYEMDTRRGTVLRVDGLRAPWL